MRFWRVRFRGLRAPAASGLRRGQGLPPLPRTPFSASGILPPLRSGQVSLDEAEHFPAPIEKPGSLRSDGVRDHPGMPFTFLRSRRSTSPESPSCAICKSKVKMCYMGASSDNQATFALAANVAAFFLTNSCTLSGPCPVSVSTSSDMRS